MVLSNSVHTVSTQRPKCCCKFTTVSKTVSIKPCVLARFCIFCRKTQRLLAVVSTNAPSNITFSATRPWRLPLRRSSASPVERDFLQTNRRTGQSDCGRQSLIMPCREKNASEQHHIRLTKQVDQATDASFWRPHVAEKTQASKTTVQGTGHTSHRQGRNLLVLDCSVSDRWA